MTPKPKSPSTPAEWLAHDLDAIRAETVREVCDRRAIRRALSARGTDGVMLASRNSHIGPGANS